jgi:hypothetical protein
MAQAEKNKEKKINNKVKQSQLNREKQIKISETKFKLGGHDIFLTTKKKKNIIKEGEKLIRPLIKKKLRDPKRS